MHLNCATADACCSCQGYTGAFIVTSQDNRPSGQGYVTFNSKESQNEAFKVCRELLCVLVGAVKTADSCQSRPGQPSMQVSEHACDML